MVSQCMKQKDNALFAKQELYNLSLCYHAAYCQGRGVIKTRFNRMRDKLVLACLSDLFVLVSDQ